jgi:hypothetical protein
MGLLDFAAQEAARQGIDPSLVMRVLNAESGGNPDSVSSKGARGPMQLMPATAKALGVNINDPLDNIRGGVRYLAQQLKSFGTPELALAAYNAGPGNVRKYGGVPPFAETQNYVGKIMGGQPSRAAADDSDIFGAPAAAPAKRTAAAIADDSDIFGAPSSAVMKPVNAAPTPKPAATQSTKPLTGLDRFAQGLRDPIDAGAQLLTNALPDSVVQAGNKLNNWLADKTGLVGKLPAGGVDQQVREAGQQYAAQRAAQGDTGFDGMRILGNIASPVNLAAMSRLPQAATLAGKIGMGALGGAGSGMLTPVTEGDFATEKGKQAALGAVLGGAVPAIGNALSRIAMPRAAANTDLQALREAGVDPTIGQALGGMANRVEEKAQSIPILGDAIMAARARARDQFNKAAINRAVGQVGGQVDDIGHSGVKQAGDAISQFYDSALSKVKAVPIDSQFQGDLSQLQSMASNLTPDMAHKFDKTLSDVVMSRVSPNGHILGQTYKTIDSDLGTIASRYGKSSAASEQEFGDAVAQLKNLLNQQMRRTNPDVADMLNQADTAWANLVRVEGAAKAAKNAEGVFTPAQLNSAVQMADKSVRGRSVARGTALMQDLSNAGQKVLGNRYPDSGTAGRLMLGGAGLGAGLVNPAIPAALLGGSALYTPMAQRFLTSLVANRPQAAGLLANGIEQGMPFLLPATGQVATGLLN